MASPLFTSEQLAALKAQRLEREARELAQHEALHEALGHLIAMKRLKLKPANANLLWAEWHYAKALHDIYSDDSTRAQLECACDNLGVDEEGNEVAA